MWMRLAKGFENARITQLSTTSISTVTAKGQQQDYSYWISSSPVARLMVAKTVRNQLVSLKGPARFASTRPQRRQNTVWFWPWRYITGDCWMMHSILFFRLWDTLAISPVHMQTMNLYHFGNPYYRCWNVTADQPAHADHDDDWFRGRVSGWHFKSVMIRSTFSTRK